MEDLEHKIKQVETRIAETRKRFPYHSVQPYLVQELEELEEELEELKKAAQQAAAPDRKNL
jgi:TolA-binding protein